MTGRSVPMFPLGVVLLPGGVLPLHIFEERYRVLVERCLAGDRRFGVVLIERGSEVGGGDVRSSVGTMAEVADAERLPDGRWVLLAVGRERIAVERWGDDDPHPVADVRLLADGEPPALEDVEALVAGLRRSLALRSELGEWTGPLDVRLPADPDGALWHLATLAELGPLDAHHLLRIDDGPARCAALRDLIEDQLALLELRIAEERR